MALRNEGKSDNWIHRLNLEISWEPLEMEIFMSQANFLVLADCKQKKSDEFQETTARSFLSKPGEVAFV